MKNEIQINLLFKFLITINFLLVFSLLAKSQNTGNKNDFDTIKYNESQQYYSLDLSKSNQFFYFDSARYDNKRPIALLLNNDTQDTILISYKSLLASSYSFKENSSRKILPGECYSISPIFNPWGTRPNEFNLNGHLLLQYKINNVPKEFFIRMRGFIRLDTLVDFPDQIEPCEIAGISNSENSVLKFTPLNDNIQHFVEGKFEYDYYILSGNQGFNFGTLHNNYLPKIYLKIINNTSENLTISYKCQDCAVYWLNKTVIGSNIAPGESFIIYSNYLKRFGKISCPVTINYSSPKLSGSITILTHGEILDTSKASIPDQSRNITGEATCVKFKGEYINCTCYNSVNKGGKWIYFDKDSLIERIEWYSICGQQPDSSYNYEYLNDERWVKNKIYKNGNYFEFYQSGELASINSRYVADSIPVYVTFHKNGNIKTETFSTNIIKWYYDSGELEGIQRLYGSESDLKWIQYYKNGSVKEEFFFSGKKIIYDEFKNKCVLEKDLKDGYEYVFKDCQMISRTSPKTERTRTVSTGIPYTIEKGEFVNQKLMNGQIEYYNENNAYLTTKLVKNGITQTCFLYNDEWVNKTDSLGKKQGKWITLFGENYEDRIISGLAYYKDNEAMDTTYRYYRSGKVQYIYLNRKKGANDSSKIWTYEYHENGFVKSTHQYSGAITNYSETKEGCPVSKTFAGFEFTYLNCELTSKNTPKFIKYLDDDTERNYSIPYMMEKGVFVTEELYNGIVQYYDKNHQLLATVKVKNHERIDDTKIDIYELINKRKSEIYGYPVNRDNSIVEIPETEASFPGGYDAIIKWISEHMIYPEIAKKDSIQGKVYISFVVERDGSLTDIKIERGVSTELDQEAIRLVTNMPKFLPGTLNGVAVRTRIRLPINFKL